MSSELYLETQPDPMDWAVSAPGLAEDTLLPWMNVHMPGVIRHPSVLSIIAFIMYYMYRHKVPINIFYEMIIFLLWKKNIDMHGCISFAGVDSWGYP